MLKLFEVKNGVEDKFLEKFDDFYTSIESANEYKNVMCFKLIEDGKENSLLGIRIHEDEILWRIERKGRKKRSRDKWFYNWKERILSMF
jgi:hypothetical protein